MSILLATAGLMYGGYTTPPSGFTDDFNRANEVVSANADWTKYASTAQAEANIVSEQAVMSSTAGGQTLIYHSS